MNSILVKQFTEDVINISEIVNTQERKQFKQTIMLYINKKLFDENQITENMFHRAKDLILRKIA